MLQNSSKILITIDLIYTIFLLTKMKICFFHKKHKLGTGKMLYIAVDGLAWHFRKEEVNGKNY